MKDIYGNIIIGNYTMNKQFIGKIVSLDNWEKEYKAKVYIKDLLPSGKYDNEIMVETLYNQNILNNTYSNKKIDIEVDNGVICKQVAINNQLVKPIIGNDVIVMFVDNDIKKAIFFNMCYTNYDNIEIIGGDDSVSNMEE